MPQKPIFAPIIQPSLFDANPNVKSLADVPADILVTIRVRMFALGALVWDYVDTMLELARCMRHPDLKTQSRLIKAIRSEYEHHRQLNQHFLNREMNWALDFEQFVQPATEEMLRALPPKSDKLFSRLSDVEYWLVVAAQQARCMLQALSLYVGGCERALEQFGVNLGNKSLLPSQFRLLESLLPRFSLGVRFDDTPRSKAANQIALELAKIVVCDADGDLPTPENLQKIN